MSKPMAKSARCRRNGRAKRSSKTQRSCPWTIGRHDCHVMSRDVSLPSPRWVCLIPRLMLKPRLSVILFAALLTLLSSGFADTVTLKSGEKLEGRILSETDTEVTIEVSVTSSIKDQRVVKKADVDKIDKVQPDAEAWVGLKNISVGEESLEPADYHRYIAVLNSFVSQFPQSSHASEAKQKVTALQEELKRVEAGEMKLGGKWLTADEVKEERVQIGGRVLLGRMKRYAAAGQLTEAMNVFETIETTANRSSS